MHHNDAPELDPRVDITDLFAFQSPADPTRSILILNVYPQASAHATFDPDASYELKIDTDGDFEAEIAFHVLFAPADQGPPSAMVYRVTGPAARGTGALGQAILQHVPVSIGSETWIAAEDPYRFYAGLRSDPFFADPVGFQNNMQWTGQDAFIDKNVLSIVLEAPKSALGAQTRIGVWARTVAPAHGAAAWANQAGRPGKNVLHGAAALNTTPPARQRELFLGQYKALFQSYGYDQDEALRWALEWLPDILPFDYSNAAGYPNGRKLTDDVADALGPMMLRGQTNDDLLGPHTDLLDDFPYLGQPHPVA